jgi:hypothetical protein
MREFRKEVFLVMQLGASGDWNPSFAYVLYQVPIRCRAWQGREYE